MNNLIFAATVMVLGLGAIGCVAGEGDEAMTARITQQLKAAGRDEYDALKDAGRKPAATARFFGVEAGMTVLDMIAAAGYNTEVLAAAVGPSGIVYAQNSHFILGVMNGARHASMLARLANERLPNVRYMVVDPEDMPFSGAIDMVFWGMNVHDIYNSFGEAEALRYLDSMRRALKPGGILAISDHVGAAGNDNAELHRIEPRIIKELLHKAGFVIDATSALLGNPDDDHSQSIYADGLRYHTDRILVRARRLE